MAAFYNTHIIGAGPAGIGFFIALENAIVKASPFTERNITGFV